LPPPPPAQYVAAPNLDCSLSGRANCTCWTGSLGPLFKAAKMPPVVAVTIDQGEKLRAEMKAAADAKRSATVTVKTAPYPYRRLSGTSMAT
jgi:hypothetical protein